jgi:hypothetical protein
MTYEHKIKVNKHSIYAGSAKYSTLQGDFRISRILGQSQASTDLIAAAYADSTWDQITSALNSFELFLSQTNMSAFWPIDEQTLCNFVHWATFSKKLSPSTIVSYMSNLKLIHELRRLNCSAFKSFLCKTHIRGAQNLAFYNQQHKGNKKVFSLALLRIMGHNIAVCDWSIHSKSIVWTAALVAFFGSFRFGELVAKSETTFNVHETLLWKDIKFFDDNSVRIHNKIPKNRTANGEYVSLFEFDSNSCCPIKALKSLKLLAGKNASEMSPVFSFSNGKLLTCNKMNGLIIHFLKPHLNEEAYAYSCKSFRAALPSALAAYPNLENDVHIKRWGRWNSSAYERYTRLSHKAKKEIFKKFVSVL